MAISYREGLHKTMKEILEKVRQSYLRKACEAALDGRMAHKRFWDIKAETCEEIAEMIEVALSMKGDEK